MKSQLLTLSRVTPSAAESRLREYLEGLDTRLTQVSPNQVILAGPHARALRDAYTKAGASAILQQAGVVKTRRCPTPKSSPSCAQETPRRHRRRRTLRRSPGFQAIGTWTTREPERPGR